MSASLPSDEIVQIARAWIGTPYRHQASVRGAGSDCLGLVRGIWRELYGAEAASVPGYTRDWAEADASEALMAAAKRHLIIIPVADAKPGAVLLFRYRPNAAAKHVAILATEETMIHAAEGAPVAEVPLGSWWQRRIVAAFVFPPMR